MCVFYFVMESSGLRWILRWILVESVADSAMDSAKITADSAMDSSGICDFWHLLWILRFHLYIAQIRLNASYQSHISHPAKTHDFA